MADRLLALLDAWGIERADVAGLDMGGQPALAFAAPHPDRVAPPGGDELAGVRRRGDVVGDPRAAPLRLEPPHPAPPAGAGVPAGRADLPAARRAAAAASCAPISGTASAGPRCGRFIAKMCAGYQGTLPRCPTCTGRSAARRWSSGASATSTSRRCTRERLHAAIAGSQLEILAEGEHWMRLAPG